MLFVAYTTAPFVTYAHINLPTFALRSREQLMKWVQRLPQNTEVQLTTMRISGLPRVSIVALSELRKSNGRLGVANLVKIPSSIPRPSRPWWKSEDPCLFYVSTERLKSQPAALWRTAAWKKAMWQQIFDQIKR